jgi:hypothetical protein
MTQTYPASASTAAVVERRPSLEWGPVFGGAIAAAAIAFLLLTFGAAIGLTMTSPWPHEGVSATTVAMVVGLWAVLVQIGAYAAGGYLAGRLRTARAESAIPEGQFRDGAHGFMAWALGVVFSTVLVGLTGMSALNTAAQSTAMVAGGAASGAAAKGTEAALATGPTDYAVDYIFRPAPAGGAPAGSAPAAAPAAPGATPAPMTAGTAQPVSAEERAEVGRIFSQTIRNREFTARERDYLTQVVVRRTGMPQPEAQKRVDEAVTEARNLEVKAREAADKTRKAALLAGFLAAASLLISAGAAAAGASLGGRHRDEGRSPEFFGSRFW